MSDICLNCKRKTNSSSSRLVKDTCGHEKCRLCLLYEENGCESCKRQANNEIQNSESLSSIKIEHHNILITNVESLKPVMTRSHNEERSDPKNCSDGSKYEFHMNNAAVEKLKIEKDGRNERNEERTAILNEPELTGIRISQRVNNKNHITIIAGNPPKYRCSICEKVFQNKKSMHYHNACVTGVKPYQCKICEKSFVNRSHYEYHERMHSGYKPFKCPLCDKAFPQKNKLTRHMLSHSNEKQFACSKCDKKYAKKSDLKSHFIVHMNNAEANKFTCDTCDKNFGNATHLKRHWRAHSNERPHACIRCRKSFKDKSLLMRHIKTHDKERPFTCDYCSRGFLTKSELTRHMTIHSDAKPFSCTYCKTDFRRKDNLNRHIRHHHSEGSESMPQETISTRNSDSEEKPRPKPKKKSKSKTKIVPQDTFVRCLIPTLSTHQNSENQINSRLDSMGNITPVIKATGELSNAVPVINGPIFKRPGNVPKKMYTYTEPIPRQEALNINKRIEAKLYPQSQNYFLQDMSDFNEGFCIQQPVSMMNSSPGFNGKQGTNTVVSCESLSRVMNKNSGATGNAVVYEEKNNCVSTIKKHVS